MAEDLKDKIKRLVHDAESPGKHTAHVLRAVANHLALRSYNHAPSMKTVEELNSAAEEVETEEAAQKQAAKAPVPVVPAEQPAAVAEEKPAE